jgi:hypothetical protein
MINAEQLDNYSWLTEWDWEKILSNLESALKHNTQSHGSAFLYENFIEKTHSTWIINASDLEGTKTTFLDVLTQPLIEYGEPKTDEQRSAAISKVIEHIKKRKHQTAIYLHKRLVEELKQRPNMTWYLFTSTINKVFQDINKIIVNATLVGAMPFSDSTVNKSYNTNSNSSEGTKSKYSKNTGKQKAQKNSNSSSKETSTDICNGCGRNKHKVDDCPLKNHPDFNKNHATIPWEETAQYAMIKEKSNGKFSWLGERYRADGSVRPEIPSKKNIKTSTK